MVRTTEPKSAWPRRVARVIAIVIVGALLYHRFVPRSADLPLVTAIDGPVPAGPHVQPSAARRNATPHTIRVAGPRSISR